MIIQIIGLPGSGKTTLAVALKERLNAIHLNADEVRADLNSDLDFSPESRVEQARRMGALARLLEKQSQTVIVDFVCPTEETRKAFGEADVVIWMDRIQESRFEDTNKMWETPEDYHIRFFDPETSVEECVENFFSFCDHQQIPVRDWMQPTTLMLGRYQPWHEGHHALYGQAQLRSPNVMLGVRSTHGTSDKDPLSFEEVKGYIDQDPVMADAMIIRMPNITNIVYGRDVGYKIEQISLGDEIKAISATQKRKELGI